MDKSMKKSKKTVIAALVIIFSVFISVPVFAAGLVSDSGSKAGEYGRLIDMAGLLTEHEEEKLIAKLDQVSEEQKLDLVIVTANSLEGSTVQEFADDFYDNHGYGYGTGRDGVLLLISMEERDWYISTCGYGITAFTDAGMDYIGEQMVDDLSQGDYAAAFTVFVEQCDQFVKQARTGEPYDKKNLPHELLSWIWLPGSFAVGLALALLVVGVMRGKLKTVHSQAAAGDYVRSGSMHITNSRDLFLYRKVNRRAKPKETASRSSGSSTHTSSSGTTHGGRGGKF